MERRGWVRDTPGDGGMRSELCRTLPGGAELRVEFSPGIFVGDPSAYIAQTLGPVRLSRGSFGDQDPIAVSEAIRDIHEACT
jgi:hypothetical protein